MFDELLRQFVLLYMSGCACRSAFRSRRSTTRSTNRPEFGHARQVRSAGRPANSDKPPRPEKDQRMELLILVLVGAIIVVVRRQTRHATRAHHHPRRSGCLVHPRSSARRTRIGILLTVVLPPLLYSAALGFLLRQLRAQHPAHPRPRVAMVVITAFAVGWVTSTVLPNSPLPSPCCSVRSSPRPMR